MIECQHAEARHPQAQPFPGSLLQDPSAWVGEGPFGVSIDTGSVLLMPLRVSNTQLVKYDDNFSKSTVLLAELWGAAELMVFESLAESWASEQSETSP